MKVIDLNVQSVEFEELLREAQQDDILLVRNGKALAKLEKFDDDDWEEWKYERSEVSLERGRRGREQYAKGQFKSLQQLQDDKTGPSSAE